MGRVYHRKRRRMTLNYYDTMNFEFGNIHYCSYCFKESEIIKDYQFRHPSESPDLYYKCDCPSAVIEYEHLEYDRQMTFEYQAKITASKKEMNEKVSLKSEDELNLFMFKLHLTELKKTYKQD